MTIIRYVYDDTGWYLVSISWYCLILGGTWSAKGLYACIYWKKWRFGRVLPMPDTQTDRQTSEYGWRFYQTPCKKGGGHQQRPGEEESLVELEEGGGSGRRGWSAFFIAASHTGYYNNIMQCSLWSAFFIAASHTEEEVSSILAMASRPAPCGSPAATIASAMRGSSASPGSLTGCKAMEEFLDSAWRGQRTTEERETLGERRRTPRGQSPILLPLDLVDFNKRK